MKRFVVFAFVLGVFVNGLWADPALLMVQGDQLVTVTGGCPVHLQGVDVPSLEYSTKTGGDGPNGVLGSISVAAKVWNANFVRVPLNQDRWLGIGGCTSSGTTYQNYVTSLVTWCMANNVYILLDLHWSDEGTAGGGTVCTSGQHDMPDDNSTLFWESVASTYANSPAVFFDLYNEPGGHSGSENTTSCVPNNATGWTLWRNGGEINCTGGEGPYHTPGMQGLLNAVRSTGAKNVVWAGGVNWAFNVPTSTYWLTDDGSGGGVNNITYTALVAGNGVVYPTHIYPFKEANNGCVSAACFEPGVAGALGKQPVMVTEFGPNSPTPATLTNDPQNFVQGILPWINGGNSAKLMMPYCAWSMNATTYPCVILNWQYTPTAYFGAYVLASMTAQSQGGCPVGTPSPTRTTTPTATPMPSCGNAVVLRVDCGSSTGYTDTSGNVWAPDTYGNGTTSNSTNTITGTTDASLYQTAQWGTPLTYAFTGLPAGNYLVTILNAEIYWTAAGDRVFNVTAQGVTVASNYDIFSAAGGENIATSLTFTTTVTSAGTLTLVGTATTNDAQFCAIELTWEGPSCGTPSATRTPSVSLTPTSNPSATATATPSSSFTYSSTPTPSVSVSPTFTGTPTYSASPTASSTYTGSVTFSVSPSFSASPTQTATPTVTDSFTTTASYSSTATETSTYTVTDSFTPSPTGTYTGTTTATPSNTPSYSASPTNTGTPTATSTASNTDTPTVSSTPSSTSTPTLSWTASATGSATPDASPSSSPSGTPTLSPSGTATPLASPSGSSTVTMDVSATPSNGPLQITGVWGIPNPNPRYLWVQLMGPADSIMVEFFTCAEIRAVANVQAGSFQIGYNRVELPKGVSGLANGIYYVRVVAMRGGSVSGAQIGKVAMLR